MSFSWHVRKRSVREMKGLLPPVHRLPVLRGAKDFISGQIADSTSVLDIGASDRNFRDFLLKKGKKEVSYRSMDIDRSLPHDYYSFDEIHETFDVILCLEVIEHLPAEEGYRLLSRAHDLLRNGGVLYLTTPNVFHPTVFWRDSTHKSGFRYGELAGLLASVGFRELEIYRVGRIRFLNRIRAFLAGPVLRLLQMDYYSRILVKACKKEGNPYRG